MTPISPARRLSAAAVVASAAVGLAGSLPAPAHAVPPGGPSSTHNGAKVALDRTKVLAGARIHVTGKRWRSKGSRVQSGTVVTVKLDDRDIVAILPIRHRRFSGWVTIPAVVRPGRHWLRFLAAKPATSVKSRMFTVTRPS